MAQRFRGNAHLWHWLMTQAICFGRSACLRLEDDLGCGDRDLVVREKEPDHKAPGG
jgi:hypothetical protein